MGKINSDKFVTVQATDNSKGGDIVEFEVHVDQILYVIGDNVYLRGSSAHVITNLRIGGVDLSNFKIAGSDLPTLPIG